MAARFFTFSTSNAKPKNTKPMSFKNVKKLSQIVIPLAAGQRKYTFPNQSFFRGKRITGLFVRSTGKTLDGKIIVFPTDGYLKLVDSENIAVIDQLPLGELLLDNANLLELDLASVVWDKSEIEFEAGSPVLAPNNAVFFIVAYE